MRRSTAIGLGAATVAVLDIAATVEALRSGHMALAVVTLLAAIGATVLVVTARRPAVEVRPDLASWTARTAAATGEPETHLINRALARHRDALDGAGGTDG